MSGRDYEIGYGKPPKLFQYQKGQSGNLGGLRRKPAPTLAKGIEEAWMTPMTVTTGRGAQKSTAFELICLQLLAKISKGVRKAHRVLLKYEDFARTKPRLKRAQHYSDERYEALLNDDPNWRSVGRKSKGEKKVITNNESAEARDKRLLARRVERMKAGLEPLTIVQGMSARDASDIYDLLLKQPHVPRRTRVRPRKGPLEASEIFDRVLNGTVALNDDGMTAAPRMLAVIRRLIANAVRGDIKSADMLVTLHEHSIKNGDFVPETKYRSTLT